MFPTVTVFGRTFTTYALAAIIGALTAGTVACRQVKRRGQDDTDAIVVLLIAAIGVLFGGHILYALTRIREFPILFSARSVKEFFAYAGNLFGGSVFYGGLFGGIFAGWIALKVKKADIELHADLFATVIPLFHAIARVGCFLVGCCYGIECEFGFTAHGNPFVPELNDVCRFPVQLLEAVGNLMLFAILSALFRKSETDTRLKGTILPIYFIGYSILRFFDEFLRGDTVRGFLFGFSTSQWISMILFAVAAVWLTVRAKRPVQTKSI